MPRLRALPSIATIPPVATARAGKKQSKTQLV